MNRKHLLIPLFIIIALLVVGPVAAQSADPVVANLSVEGDGLTVGDPIQLTLTIDHPANYHVILPELERNWGDFVVHSQSPPTTVSNSDGTKTTSLVIDARLFAPGTYSTPPLTVTVTDSAGQLSEVNAAPATVNIASVLVEGDTELRDIKPQAELPYSNLLPWILGGLLTAIAVGAIAWLIRRRARLAVTAVDDRLPHEIAFDELARIEALGLPDAGRFKEHYTFVSDCIRVYMERIYEFPVVERTTTEIQASLKDFGINPSVGRQFVSFLDASDLVKFSKYKPDVDSAYRLLAFARQIVEETKPIEPSTEAANGTAPTADRPSEASFSTNGKVQRTEVSA